MFSENNSEIYFAQYFISHYLTLPDLGYVLLPDTWYAPVADDKRPAHSAAITGNMACLSLDMDVYKLVDVSLSSHIPERMCHGTRQAMEVVPSKVFSNDPFPHPL